MRVEVIEEEEEVEENLPWIQEKALDLVEFTGTGTVTQAIPGLRVGQCPLLWILAVPLAYVGLSFFIAMVKTVKKFTSPKAKKKRLVNKNAFLLKSIDEWFQKGKDEVSKLKGLYAEVNKNVFLLKSIDEWFQKGKDEVSNLALKGLYAEGFSMDAILRKYIRYALNEKPFNSDLVVDLTHLRKASMLEDPQVAEVLNEKSRRIVKEKGPVVMDISGFTEKGFK